MSALDVVVGVVAVAALLFVGFLVAWNAAAKKVGGDLDV